MHIELVKALLPTIRKRVSEGDCPTTQAIPTEQLEDIALTLELEIKRLRQGLEAIADGEGDPQEIACQTLAT